MRRDAIMKPRELLPLKVSLYTLNKEEMRETVNTGA